MFKDIEMFIDYINVQVLHEVEKIKKAQKQGYTIIPNNENHLYMFDDEDIQIFIDTENYFVMYDDTYGDIYNEYVGDFDKEDFLQSIKVYVLDKLELGTKESTIEMAKTFLKKDKEINKALNDYKTYLEEKIAEVKEKLDLINKD